MRTSPRRPLILKRRKLSMPVEDAAAASRRPATKGETDGRCSAVPSGQHPIDPGADPQKVPAGIKIMNHPTMPNTQVVFIPKHADIQSIIAALTAKGKECGSTGPNKFILISGGGTLHPSCPPETQGQTGQDAGFGGGGTRYTDCEDGRGVSHKDVEMEDLLLQTVKHLAPEPHSKQESENNSGAQSNCTLDESLTNIQWLGKMSSDGLGSCDVKQELENKENQAPEREFPREEDVDFNPSSSSFSAWQKSISERPPYSYMAMIQFAINSTERKRMTLKEIYTWIEDHFPYFKHVAKPGWKNSIRHNLSLHDMFVRETSANGKISFWTIHPDANRCLTLDQVFKPMDQDTPLHLLPCEPQQKRLLPELQKSVAGGSGIKSDIPGGIGAAERKMKLLLPRVNSYFVPFQFPVNQAFVQQPPGKASLNSVSSVSTTDLTKASKRVQIAPKTQTSKEDTIALVEAPSTAIKEENEKSSFSCSKGKVSFTAFTSPAWQIPGIQIPSKEDNIALKNKPPTAAIKEEFEVEVEVEEEEQEVEVAALAKLSCPRENILYTALKPPAWKMPDKQASMVKDGSSHIPPAKELTSLAVKDSRFSVLRADVPLSSWKEDRTLYTSKSPARKIPDMQVIRRRKGGSRRKQHLAIPCAEEPLLFPECSNSDSGLVSDFSFLQETHALEPSTDFSCTQENFSFKTPIKEKFKLPASSTPSKPNGAAPPAGSSDPWRVTSLNKDADLPDFSPVRLPQGTTLTPLKDTLDLLAFSSPPFNDLPLFDSPQQLLNNKSPEVTSGPFTNSPTFEPLSAKRCAKELQIGSSTNRSLTEGLVLDTMNDSLSKILLDISFSGLEDDDDFERDNVSWSQFIPELR